MQIKKERYKNLVLITKELNIPILNNAKYYEALGYYIPRSPVKNNPKKLSVKRGTTILVKIDDVNTNSSSYVEYFCDYCLDKGVETKLSTPYKVYLDCRKKIEKDSCNKCKGIKIIESNQKYYGVNSTAQIKEIRDQQLKTLDDNYGVDNPLKSEDIRKRVVKTNLIRYGVEYGLQNEEVKQKKIITYFKKYGCQNPMQTEKVQQKLQNTLMELYGVSFAGQIESGKVKKIITCLRKYGVTHPMKIKEKAINAKIKGNLTMYNNQTMTSSKQQRYINILLKGKLNYPVGLCSLDIAFPEENIYIEYDGSGHDLSIKCNSISSKMFVIKQMKRYYYLKDRGWSMIRLISLKDYLPSDEIILELIDIAKQYINTGHSWFNIYIEEKKLECREYTINYDFGELRKIDKEEVPVSG